MPGALHITNGESVKLSEIGIGGEVLSWNDVLHEGPVPAGLTLEELSAVRAQFISDLELEGYEKRSVLEIFRERDCKLASFHNYGEVVLWFEHDLFDQLQFIQILDWFADRDLDSTRLSVISVDTYLGHLEPEHLAGLYPLRHPATREELEEARRAWRAFTSPAPTVLADLLLEGTPALPFLRGAILRLLQQFPSVTNGLARTEKQILEAAEREESTVRELFLADQQREQRIFMGDAIFVTYLQRLVEVRVPLLKVTAEAANFLDARVQITSQGRAVLAGEADHIRLNGIDRWLGGVHLVGKEVWRWDGERRAAVLRP